VFASLPDLLRLLAVPVFGYVAYRDVRTRRVPNRIWYPLAALGVVLLAWEALALFAGPAAGFQRQRFLLQVALSLGFVIPLSYGFWLLGGFGGADAKAFFVVAILFPTYPVYNLWELGLGGSLTHLPVVATAVGVFSLTILSNTVLAGLAYPVALAGRNAASGYVSPGMFVATPVHPREAVTRYGTMLEFADRSLAEDLSLSGLRSYFSWRGLDLDALRMYLQWRGVDLAALREDPSQFRDPASLPDEPNPPGDGSMATDGGTRRTGADTAGTDRTPGDDPWGAAAFLDDIEGDAYGTTPATLREGLDTLVAEDVVWISPGIPFLVPLFAGLLLALTYGDLLFGILQVLGLV
jgi:preflagellin peptidase FlaK